MHEARTHGSNLAGVPGRGLGLQVPSLAPFPRLPLSRAKDDGVRAAGMQPDAIPTCLNCVEDVGPLQYSPAPQRHLRSCER
jgi:hypothetical protein